MVNAHENNSLDNRFVCFVLYLVLGFSLFWAGVIMRAIPLDDLEMFELLQAAYPEKFPDDNDDSFDAAMEFAENLSGFDELADLLGRVVMLAMPMESPITGRLQHCLGLVQLDKPINRFTMLAVVKRDFRADQGEQHADI